MTKNKLLPFLLLLSSCSNAVAGSSMNSEVSSQFSSDAESSISNSSISVDSSSIEISDEEYFSTFTPSIRFLAASDTHIKSEDTYEERRLKKTIQMAYTYANEDENYKSLDAAIWVGDFTDLGTRDQFIKFKRIIKEEEDENIENIVSLGNHEYWYTDMEIGEMEDTYKSLFHVKDIDFHTVVNGFDFISIAPAAAGNGYKDSQAEWLENEIVEIEKQNKNQPIFVLSHIPTRNTVYGTTGGSNLYSNGLESVLKNHPECVNLTGHTHFPNTDPRALWQGQFTSIGLGGLSYFEVAITDVIDKGLHPTNKFGGYTSDWYYFDQGQFQIIEVDNNGAMKIIGFDTISGSKTFERCVRSTTNKEKFVSNITKTKLSETPYFEEEEKISIKEQQSGTISFNIPAAICKDNVEHYLIKVKSMYEIKTYYLLSDTFVFPNPQVLNLKIDSLRSGDEYTMSVKAISSYKKESSELKFTFTA